MMSRRALLKGMAIGTAGAVATAAMGAQPSPAGESEAKIVINSMGGLEDPNHPSDDLFTVRSSTLDAFRESGLTAFIQTISDIAPEKGADYFEQTVRDIGRWNAIVRNNKSALLLATTPEDIVKAWREHKVAIIYGLQNGAAIGEKADRVETLADLGVRSFQLTYNLANPLGCGALSPTDTGLTKLGVEVIERASAKPLMIDLSHSGRQTCLQAATRSRVPVSINHTGCAAINPSPRSKSDEELRLVASKGGYIGIFTMPYLASGRRITADDVILHIQHALKVCGEDHVGIGTDNSLVGIVDMPSYMAAYRREVNARRAAGISAPGEDPEIPRFAAELDGPQQYAVLAERMRSHGLPSRVIDKVMGMNFLAFARLRWNG